MSARQIAEAKISEARPDEAFNAITHRLKHTANLSVDSLLQYNAQAGWLMRVQMRDARAFAIQDYSVKEFGRERRVPCSIQGDFVFLVDLVTRMGKMLREVAVVRQNQQTFALRVETADIEQPRKFRGQQIEDCVPRVWIFPGRNKSSRFVQDNVQRPLRVHELAIHFHVVALVRLRAEVCADFSVYGDATGRYQFVTIPARADSGSCEKTVQPHG